MIILIFLFMFLSVYCIIGIYNYSKETIYRVELINIFIITIITIFFKIIFNFFRIIIPEIFNIHLNFHNNFDFFTIYGCILSLLLPLVILLIERINDKRDYIITETYLRETKMFPCLIYFCINFLILFFSGDLYYFLVSVVLSMFFIIMMYYKSYKLLSNMVHETSEISKTRNLLIMEDLDMQLKHIKNNKIKKYYNYGIFVEKHNYFSTENYKVLKIYSNNDLILIEDYNYKCIEKIMEILKKINIETQKTAHNELNIIVCLKDIGFTLQNQQGYATIYYKSTYEELAIKIASLIDEKIYKTTEHNTHFYVKNNYEFIQRDCVDAINNESALQLELALKKYIEIYKDYIVGIQEKIGDYNYDLAYQHNHSIIRHRSYELLELIVDDIIDYSNMIKNKNDCLMMNRLISYLYKMVLFSFEKKELLSTERLFGVFEYLLNISLKLDESDSTKKIEIVVFEFTNIVKYEISNNKNVMSNKDILLVCNKTISKILYTLYKVNNKNFQKWFNKYSKFIDDIKEKKDMLLIKQNENNDLLNCYNELIKHFECNLFATSSYMLKYDNNNNFFDLIYKYYDNYCSEELSEVYLNTLQLDFDDHTYSWDLLEERDFDGEFFYVNTTDYITFLYCCLICRKNINQIKLPINYAMMTRNDNIINKLQELGKSEYVPLFEKNKQDYENNKEQKIIKTSISDERINNFINNFNKHYNESNLYNLLKINSKINIVKEDITSKNYLHFNNIVDKEYFLNQDIIDENIMWDNFEKYFVDSFTRAEEAKYSELLSSSSNLVEKSIFDYLNEINSNTVENYIIFKNYKSLYKIKGYEEIVWQLPDDVQSKYNNIASCYFHINNKYIPIIDLEGLDDSVYLVKNNNLLSMNKSERGFMFDIIDFLNNEDKLNYYMSNKVENLNLEGEDRRKHLLLSVIINIKEYIFFGDEKFISYKFNRK